MSVGFEPAVELILKHEGGYVNHPDDPGGETNFGIAKRSYPDLDIAKLSKHDAKRIYKEDYWDKVRGDEMHPAVALMVFDTAVNMGISRASKFLQEVVNANPIDGIIGSGTLQNCNNACENAVEFVLESYANKRLDYYKKLSTFDTFGKGWTRRVEETLEAAKELV